MVLSTKIEELEEMIVRPQCNVVSYQNFEESPTLEANLIIYIVTTIVVVVVTTICAL